MISQDSKTLLVPIHLDGLYLDKDTDVAQPLLDFSKIPRNNKKAAFIADTLKATDTVTLQKGLHLHWALPDALAKSMELRIVRKSTFELKLPVPIAASIWNAMLDDKINWIRKISSTIGVSAPKDERMQSLTLLEADSVLLKYLDLINMILDQPALPPAPNRWLISSFAKPDKIDHCWYLESDYQYPNKKAPAGKEAHVAFPYFDEIIKVNNADFNKPPINLGDNNYRIIGRKTYCKNSFSNLSGTSSPTDFRTESITALGYGDPNFAAFYPNCINIFGIHAEGNPASINPPCGTTYEIIGWHSDPELDYYSLFIQDFIQQKISTSTADYIALLKEIKRQFNWLIPIKIEQSAFKNINVTIDNASKNAWDYLIDIGWLADPNGNTSTTIAPPVLGHDVHLNIYFSQCKDQIYTVLNDAIEKQLPKRQLCYTRRSINLEGKLSTTFEPSDIEVIVGRTGAEAMAALLAKSKTTKLSDDPSHQQQIEDQLAALLYAGKRSEKQLDQAAKLAEARHDKAFIAENGGSIWTVRPMSFNEAKTTKEPNTQVTLPLDLADLLNELNLAQQALDRQDFKIQSTRQQIYLDWCKYQKSLYDSSGNQQNLLDYILNLDGKNNNPQSTVQLNAMLKQQKPLFATFNLAKKNVEDRLNELHYFGFNEVSDWSNLLTDLQKTTHVRFAGSFATSLGKYPPYELTDDQKESILEALNDIIDASTFPLKGKAQDLPANAYKIWQDKNSKMPEQRFNRLLLESLFPSLKKSPYYILQSKAAPRFWEPRDPVVLFNGKALTPNTRNSNSNPLSCQILDYNLKVCASKLVSDPNWATEVQGLYKATHTALNITYPNLFKFAPQTEEPAYPFILDWITDFNPAKNTPPQGQDYQTDYISTNYQLQQNQVDFTYDSTKSIKDGSSPSTISGRTMLSAHAGNRLQTALDTFLVAKYPNKDYTTFFTKNTVIQTYSKGIDQSGLKSKLDDFINWCQERIQLKASYFKHLQAKGTTPSSEDDYYIGLHLQDFQKWLKNEVGTLYQSDYDNLSFNIVIAQIQNEIAEAYHTAIYILCDMSIKNTTVISQSLGGFHEAMLMKNFGYQLEVYDPSMLLPIPPVNKSKLKNNQEIRAAVGTQNITSPANSPNSLPTFNPIRAGGLLLNTLTLIDTFGRTLLTMDQATIQKQLSIATPLMMQGENKAYIGLNPRYTQSARLNFRFLSAYDDTVEMNDHVASSPICGWLLPNLLDNSLMVYGQDGKALGYVDQEGRWQVYPSNSGPTYLDAIPNETLSQVIDWICSNAANQGFSTFMNDFLGVLANGIEHADPEAFAQHQALALLMGRPLAVIKTTLELELKGQLAINQDADHIIDPATNGFPSTQKFEEVEIPIRLGEYEQLNDGLIGYWIDQPSLMTNTFYTPQSESVAAKHIKGVNNGIDTSTVLLTPKDGPKIVTMIVEPQGYIHATSGILPAKSIQIPTDQYAQALKNIEIAFLSTPLITPANQLNISLPKEAGYAWSWLQNIEGQWKEISNQGKIKQQDLENVFPNNWIHIWEQLLSKGWLEKDTASTAYIVARDQRSAPTLDEAFVDYTAPIEYLLRTHQLFPFSSKASFSGKQIIKEGWLRLKEE